MRFIFAIALCSVLLFGCTQGGSYDEEKGPGMQQEGGNENAPLANDAPSGEDLLVIPKGEITGKASFYSVKSWQSEVRFFSVKGSNGEIHVAFDACDVCGGRKGYAQKGNEMVCNNCGRHFRTDDIGTKNLGGGCWPAYLPYKEVGESIVIDKSDVLKGSWMFKG